MTPTDTDRERARLLIEEAVEWGRHNIPNPGALLMHWRIERALRDKIAAALAEARRGGLEEAARLVDHHPFADDATEGCIDAQGCCEMMAAQIRALAAPDQGTT